MKNLIKHSRFMRKTVAFTLALVMGVTLVGCGSNTGGEDEEAVQLGIDGYVYVPEFTNPDFDGNYPSNLLFQNGSMYYTTYSYDPDTQTSTETVNRLDVATGEKDVLSLDFGGGEDAQTSLYSFFMDGEGNMYAVLSIYPIVDGMSDWENRTYSLNKYTADGTLVYSQDITESLMADPENSYVYGAAADSEGRVYMAGSTVVWIFNAEGALQATVDAQANWISGVGVTKEGEVYLQRYGQNGTELVLIDPQTNSLGAVHTGVPSSSSNGTIMTGLDKGFLFNGSTALYQYDPQTEETETILNWSDSDIIGSYVRAVGVLEDGRLVAFSSIYSSQENTYELAYLTKTEASQVTEKQLVVLGTLYGTSQDLQEKVVAFNKSSSEYHVTIKAYIDESAEWTETTYTDGITALNNAITSSNCPDIIDLSYANISNYMAKGVLEDLYTYLDNSTVLSRGDFIENALNAYTYGGKLATIPTQVRITTVVGRASQLGDRTGWTIDEIIDFADSYPDAKLFNYATKASILQNCLQYSSGAFIDYEAGECHFDTEDFIKVLEFANRFDMEYTYDEDRPSLPDMVHSGELLLEDLSLWDITEFQMYSLMFEEPLTFVGYPTVDGSVGTVLSGSNVYGIASASSCKEGAWAFLESMLGYEPYNNWYMSGFPIREDMLGEMLEKSMEKEYEIDWETGEPRLDENGEPVERPKTSWGYDNWNADIYAATQEQVDTIRHLIDIATSVVNNDTTISEMIYEEAQPYFEGQKTAEEVAAIIQSRVQIYISENM